MLSTLTLTAALALAPAQTAPAQPGALSFVNVATTYGELGATRPDARYLPGDLFFLSFDIEGLTLAPDGKVQYTMGMEVVDRAGKQIMVSKPTDSDDFLPLGGRRMHGRGYYPIEPDRAPGTYTCKLTVTDRATKATKTLEKSFEVLPKGFGLIGLYTTADREGKHPIPPSGVVGQQLHIHALLVGFGRNRMNQPDATIELRLLDENRKPTIAKPATTTVPKELSPMEEVVYVYFLVPFNREGTFTAEMKATDAVSGKTSSVAFPVKVGPTPR